MRERERERESICLIQVGYVSADYVLNGEAYITHHACNEPSLSEHTRGYQKVRRQKFL